MRRFRRKRRVWWTGTNSLITIAAGLAFDYTAFATLVRSDEIVDRNPEGATVLRIVGEILPWIIGTGSASIGANTPMDVFIMAQTSAQDDAGTELWQSGVNILKPFVQPDLANFDIAGSRKFMWTKRYYTLPLSLIANQAVMGSAAFANYLPKASHELYMDLRVKRRLQPGEDVIMGIHFPAGTPNLATFQLSFVFRILLAAK